MFLNQDAAQCKEGHADLGAEERPGAWAADSAAGAAAAAGPAAGAAAGAAESAAKSEGTVEA